MRIFSIYLGLNKEIYILFLCKLIDHLGSLVGPMLTLILSIKMGMSARDIALYTTFFTILSLPINLLAGKLADKYNKKLIINIADITSTIAYLVCGYIGLNQTTLFIYMIGSLIQNAENPAYDSLIADLTTSKDRDRAYSLSYVGLNLGLMLAPTIGGLLLNEHIDLMFTISGISELISIILFNIFVRNVKPIEDHSNIYEEKQDSMNIIKVFKENKVVLYIILIFALGAIIYNMYGYLMPLTLSLFKSESGSIFYGTMSSLNCITVLLFTSILTVLTQKMHSIDRMILAEVFIGVGYIMFVTLINYPITYYPTIVIFTFGEIINTISSSPYLTRRIPLNFRGRINSICDVTCMIASSLSQIVIGSIFDSYGYKYAWMIVIIAVILIIISFAIIKNKDKKAYPDLYKNNIA